MARHLSVVIDGASYRLGPLGVGSQCHGYQGEVTLEGAAMSPLARREATRLAQPPERRQYANR